jgi:hypothetical protein
MALFTDGPISTLLDLQNNESSILTVANTAGIDLAGKLTLAQGDIADEVLLFLLRRWTCPEGQWNDRRIRGVCDVVVTAPLRQWHVHHALALVYRDVYNSQLNDRFLGKWKEYEQLAKLGSDKYFHIGVGLVADPLPRPCSPLLVAIIGSGPAVTYYVAATWVNGAGQESSPSDIGQVNTSTGEQLTVALANPPATASGWNVYMGEGADSLSLQNEVPIGVNSSWSTTGPPVPGRTASRGQEPTWFLVDYRLMERG